MIKKILVPIFILLYTRILYAQQEIKELSYFRLQGVFELRALPDSKKESFGYLTLNHEGGIKVRVLEIGENEIHNNQKGRWLYVLVTAPI